MTTVWQYKYGQAYTTGAILVPVFLDGRWRWVVSEFTDDTYDSDGEYVDAKEAADDMFGLIREYEEAEE